MSAQAGGAVLDEKRTLSDGHGRLKLTEAMGHDAVFEVPAGVVHPIDTKAF